MPYGHGYDRGYGYDRGFRGGARGYDRGSAEDRGDTTAATRARRGGRTTGRRFPSPSSPSAGTR
jgi:hypothetical protein